MNILDQMHSGYEPDRLQGFTTHSFNPLGCSSSGANALAACGQAYMNRPELMFNNPDTVIKHYDVSCSENVYPVKNFNSMNKKLEAAKKWLKERKTCQTQ